MKIFKNSIWKWYCVTIWLLFISSMFPWFFWDLPNAVVPIVGVSVVSLCILSNGDKFLVTNNNLVAMVILSFMTMFCGVRGNLNFFIVHASIFIIVSSVICLRYHCKVFLLSKMTRWFGLLLGVSLGAFIVHLTGVPMPHESIQYIDGRYNVENYYLFLSSDSTSYIRFRSIFMEPGHMAMGLVPILYANKFNLRRWDIIIIFLAGLFSLSLAAYITIAIGLFVFTTSKTPERKRARVTVGFAIIVMVLLLTFNYGGFLSEAIFSRLEVEDGKLAGYNRYSTALDYYFRHFVTTPEMWFGISAQNYLGLELGPASGFKVYWIQYGLVGMISVVAFYAACCIQNNTYVSLGFFVVMMLLFFQNAYPLWYAPLLTYIIGVTTLGRVRL